MSILQKQTNRLEMKTYFLSTSVSLIRRGDKNNTIVLHGYLNETACKITFLLMHDVDSSMLIEKELCENLNVTCVYNSAALRKSLDLMIPRNTRYTRLALSI